MDEVLITLPKALRVRVEDLWNRRVKATVHANIDRNDILQSYADELDGLGASTVPTDSKASQIDDSITFEHHTHLTAYIQARNRQEPFILIAAVNPEDQSSAAALESTMSVKAREWHVRERLFDAAYDAGQYPIAWLKATWIEEQKRRRFTAYQTPDNPDLVEAEELQPDTQYTAVPQAQMLMAYEGPEITSVDPRDLYLWPPNVQSHRKAEAVIERLWLTAAELWNGVKQLGFDKESVLEAFEKGPTDTASPERQDDDANDGIGVTGEKDAGFYECFQIIGRFPLLTKDNGDVETPDDYLNEDFLWIICPEYNLTFKFAPYPYGIRPYARFNILRKPRRLMGKCVPQILETHQVEGTALRRFVIDQANLMAQPPVKMPLSMIGNNPFATWGIGKKIGYDDRLGPGSIEVLHTPLSEIVNSISQLSADVRMRANELMSAQGTDNIQPGMPPTATQASIVAQGAVNKRDLMGSQFDEGLEELAEILAVLWMTHMPVDGETIATGQDSSITITPGDIDRKFRFIANANTDASNPQIRMQKGQLARQLQLTYFQNLMQAPQYAEYWYHSARRGLEELNERDIDGFIGKEPVAGDPSIILQQVGQMIMQAFQTAQQKQDPIAPVLGQIVQMMQQAMTPNPNGQPGAPAAGPANPMAISQATALPAQGALPQ